MGSVAGSVVFTVSLITQIYYAGHMICLQGRNKVKMTEVAYVKESITPDNVYIIDNGLTIYQVSYSYCFLMQNNVSC